MASFAVMQMHASAMAGQVNLGRSKASLQPSGRSGCITPKLRFVVRAHGHGTTEQRMRPGEKKGFVEEMRFVAMKLHTKEQAPKEGEAKPAPQPMKQFRRERTTAELITRITDAAPEHAHKPRIEGQVEVVTLFLLVGRMMHLAQWVPTREGYLQYLAESQIVYAAMEKIMKDAPVDSCEYPVFGLTLAVQGIFQIQFNVVLLCAIARRVKVLGGTSHFRVSLIWILVTPLKYAFQTTNTSSSRTRVWSVRGRWRRTLRGSRRPTYVAKFNQNPTRYPLSLFTITISDVPRRQRSSQSPRIGSANLFPGMEPKALEADGPGTTYKK
eukprot:1179748-Prorocentrum_minimum.AAC.3